MEEITHHNNRYPSNILNASYEAINTAAIKVVTLVLLLALMSCGQSNESSLGTPQPHSKAPIRATVSERAVAANPKYKDYPAPPLYTGPAAKLVLDNDLAKEYRSRLNEAMKGKPVFAGEYVETGWGCGTGGCYVTAFVNKRTGKVLEQTFLAYSSFDDVTGIEERIGEEIEPLKLNSRLLVTQEITEGEPKERSYFANFYKLDGDKLKLIKRVAIPKKPTGEGT